ncbi:tyrosine-type recombinase/integrase [Roseomonas sp. BN140053]|uniref:tyrosine-type recombinase/integrase n=1 Tax=Roseomonas sp. BN140053 TaxID=3391898 RepID=UPI0039EBD37F
MKTTRKEIHERVWSKPIRQAAEHFGCSDSYLARLCRELAIPLPMRGHWLLPAERRLPPPALPALLPGRSEVVWIGEGRTRLPPRVQAVPSVFSNAESVAAKRPKPITAHLERAAGGIFHIAWKEGRKFRRISTETSDTEEAARLLSIWQQGLEREAARSGLSVRQALDDYFTEHVHPKVDAKQTAEFARRMLEQHFGHMSVASINPGDVRSFVHRRRTGKLTGTRGRLARDPTIRRELGVLVAALNHAVREGRLSRADVPAIPLPDAGEPRETWLREPETERLLAAARRTSTSRRSRIERFVYLAYYTAARKRSLETLEWSQVDLHAGLIHLRKPDSKRTKKRRPTVHIHPRLREVLEAAAAERLPDGSGGLSPWVLDEPGSIRTAFESAVRRAGLASDVTAHVLRHTAATHMLRRGVPIWNVSEALGNSVAMVQRVYGHHVPDATRAAIEALG